MTINGYNGVANLNSATVKQNLYAPPFKTYVIIYNKYTCKSKNNEVGGWAFNLR